MSTTHRQFHVGDHVRIDFGRRKLTGVIVEDRGPLGIQGRHLFQVDIPMDPFEPMTLEMPEDGMEAIAPGSEPPTSLETGKIIEYLINGGLASILRSNITGEKYQPRVWLCLDQLGNVTHTFVEERGIVGGQMPPSYALNGQRIFTRHQDSVIEFVESFGLNRPQAEQVVAKVGTAS